MFGFKILKIDKRNSLATYTSLLNIEKPEKYAKLLQILNLFDLENVSLKCSMWVKNDSVFLDLAKYGDDFVVNVKEAKKFLLRKKPRFYIEILFFGKSLNIILDLARKGGEPLCIVPQDENDKTIEISMNDNDYDYINFSTKKYNVSDIEDKIKQIIRKHKLK